MNDSARILVVDDDSQITRVLTTVLASQGYATRAAPDGVAAHAIVAEWQPDLVLTDLGMPRMNGIDLCRRIRILTTAPIIVLSVKDAERSPGLWQRPCSRQTRRKPASDNRHRGPGVAGANDQNVG